MYIIIFIFILKRKFILNKNKNKICQHFLVNKFRLSFLLIKFRHFVAKGGDEESDTWKEKKHATCKN